MTAEAPADVDTEAAVIGAMLTGESVVTEVLDRLTTADFYRPAHRTVFATVAGLRDRGVPVDPHTVRAALADGGQLEDMGGAPFVFGLVEAAALNGTLAHHTGRLLELARRRRILDLGTRLTTLAGQPGQDLGKLLEDAESTVATLRQPSGDRAADGPARELATIRASKVEPERVTWLWPGRIPAGKLTVFDGDPGLGKSTITLDVAARLTTGSPLPDGYRPDRAVKVALLGAEDGIADTIVPRLAAAGADRDAIEIIEHVTDADGARPVELPADIDRLTDFIGEQDIKLVILDPLMAFLAGGVDAHRDQDVRRVLHRLKLMAEETGASLLPIRHLNKVAGGNPLYRGGGSIGIVGAARAGLLVAPDPGDETGARRVLAVTKSNLAAMPDSLAYRVIGDDRYDVARIAWDGTADFTAADLLGVPVVEHDSPERDRAGDLLLQWLAKGAQSRSDLENLAEDAFVSPATLKRAAKELGVQVERRPEKGKRGRGPAWWSLPNTAHGGDGQLSMDDDADPQVTDAITDHPNTAQPANTTGELYSNEPEPQVTGPEPAVEANTAHRLTDGRADAARPRRIQLQRTKGWKLPAGAIRVDHGARKPMRKYGNRFDWRQLGRPKAVELYREHQLPEVAPDAPGDLGGHDLACWCPPGEPCHVDLLLTAANP